ncbi:hypothetical protein EVAR_89966_1 [Eumeta japonica]|uniref:Uncharacterized protein n=1 Tax=Eumeta variegata TaxID=151549 RepID=A0A4C2ACQ5_EUMVA|nr:hypothetical protein EVAR_89966_1 [Eumeta japonica]
MFSFCPRPVYWRRSRHIGECTFESTPTMTRSLAAFSTEPRSLGMVRSLIESSQRSHISHLGQHALPYSAGWMCASAVSVRFVRVTIIPALVVPV